jgi:hypothetical protein
LKDIENYIREHWFKDHKAELIDLGGVQVLNWKKPGTGVYRVRYVFDGCMMYISGDIGTAVFWLTWKADVNSFNDKSIGYFSEKLSAFSDERWDFDTDKAVKSLREWLNERKKCGKTYDHDEMRELFDDAGNCGSCSEWAEITHRYEPLISKLDQDYWEWFYEIGREYPSRIYGYLIGLKMASEQLRATEQVSA